MHFFITGHTGFKGSWLVLLLKELGHEVSGYSLEPERGALFDRIQLQTQMKRHFIGDVRDLEHLKESLSVSQPDFALHLAAQPLVIRSYKDPIETYTTNVDGTRNFLEAISSLKKPPVSLVVTTDKVYRDDGKGSYTEADPLGGHDPYSASKAMADILTQSWAATNPQLRLKVARAGNVIGGFDVCENRLIPDALRAIAGNKELIIRNPDAVRPWQHVLDCLYGYILFLQAAQAGEQTPVALNFGPDPSSIRTVSEVLAQAQKTVAELRYRIEGSPSSLKETQLLTLDSSAAQRLLSWRNVIPFEKAVSLSFEQLSPEEPLSIVRRQIKDFLVGFDSK